MSRHGYSEDLDHLDLGRWRGRVASALRGRRGQALLRDIAAGMDAMPEKRLASRALQTPDGGFCALGCAMKHRGLEVPIEEDADDFDAGWTARQLDIVECLAQEVSFVNDDGVWGRDETDEARWVRVRNWVVEHLAKEDAAIGAQSDYLANPPTQLPSMLGSRAPVPGGAVEGGGS